MLSTLFSSDQQKKYLQYVSVAGRFTETSLKYTFILTHIKPAYEDSCSSSFVLLVILLAEIQHLCISSSKTLPCTDMQVGGKANNDQFMCRKKRGFFVRKLGGIWRDEFLEEALIVLIKEILGLPQGTQGSTLMMYEQNDWMFSLSAAG